MLKLPGKMLHFYRPWDPDSLIWNWCIFLTTLLITLLWSSLLPMWHIYLAYYDSLGNINFQFIWTYVIIPPVVHIHRLFWIASPLRIAKYWYPNTLHCERRTAAAMTLMYQLKNCWISSYIYHISLHMPIQCYSTIHSLICGLVPR